MFEFFFITGVLIGEFGLIGFILTRNEDDLETDHSYATLINGICFQIFISLMLFLTKGRTGIKDVRIMIGISILVGYIVLLQYVMNPEAYMVKEPKISTTDAIYSILIVFVAVLPIEVLNSQFRWWDEPSLPSSIFPFFSTLWSLLFTSFPWNTLSISSFIFWLSLGLATPISFSSTNMIKDYFASRQPHYFRGKEEEIIQILVALVGAILTMFFFLIGGFLK